MKGNWRKISWDFYTCDDVGNAFASDDGWRVHRGLYREPLVEPIVGPMRSRIAAIEKFEKVITRLGDKDRRLRRR